jgi:arylsulfatase A-like enzyme
VIFSSDNGTTHAGPPGTKFYIGGADPIFFNSTANLRGYKGSVYEGGMRVPMIACLPGKIAAGVVNDTPSYFPDWFPTLCDAAGLEQPAGLDGQSLWPVLTGKGNLKSRKPMIWVFPEYGGQVAVRLVDMKFVRQKLKTKMPGPWEAYDLSKDPSETTDLAATQGQLIKRVEQLLKQEVADNPTFPLTIPGVNEPSQ